MAMLPRDLFWRSLVILAVYLVSSGVVNSSLSRSVTAATVVAFAGLALTVAVLLQFVLGIRPRLRAFAANTVKPSTESSERAWLRVSIGLWLTSVLKTGSENLSVILVGLALSPTVSGGVFAALKIAMLMNFLLVAANLVVSPVIARAWHEGKLDELRKVRPV